MRWFRKATVASCCLTISLLVTCLNVSAETLADIDAEIQTDKNIQTHRPGLDAYNIYDGVTNSRLDRKIIILQAAGIHPRFYQNSAGGTDYTNFYSFTSLTGVTDTKLDLVTTTAVQRLYRRGSSGYQEASGYLGSWWGDKYRGIKASRDEQAILAAWGSDLQRIYVIDVPAGYKLVGGIASPMEKDGEYRQGGAYQYYYRGAPASWLVYALYAPDYLKSYAGAVSSAQLAGRSLATDLGLHLNQVRFGGIPYENGEFWLRGFAGNLDYNEFDNGAVNSRTGGLSLGWQRLTHGGKSPDQARTYFGFMLAQVNNFQKYDSHVENRTQAIVGGIYGLYVNRPDSARSWYGHWSLLHGGLKFNNTVPGELGYGLKQEYSGNITALTLENGVTLRQKHGWILEPQLQLSYTKVGHNDFTDKLGATVSLRQSEALWGRLGLEARRTIGSPTQRKSNYWTRLSYVHAFSGRNELDVAGDRAISETRRNSWQLGMGADLHLDRKWRLKGEVVKVFGGERGFQANLSLKLDW